MRSLLAAALSAIALFGLATQSADAQSLGTFRWQLQPYCNVLTVVVTPVGAVYRVEGTDDQCGAATSAAVIGTAFPNPNGSIGFGLNVVAAPGGTATPIDATIALATLSGSWRDSGGRSGTFAFTPGAGTGGGPRPAPTAAVPATIRLLTDGGLLAGGQLDLGTIPATGAGTRMMWHPRKAAFRAGKVDGPHWDEPSVGVFSSALGYNTKATGFAAVAIGNGAVAVGDDSVALGQYPLASGSGSVALGSATTASNSAALATGYATVASGAHSTAMGQTTTASGQASTALGLGTTASGYSSLAGGVFSSAPGQNSLAFGHGAEAGGGYSVVLGSFARTSAAAVGSFMFGDRSTGDPFQSNAPNEFGARFAGGFYLYTRSDLSTGAALAANGSSWAALSDVNAKENFRDVDGEDLLTRLARIPIREWNYKAQTAAIRHMGPTAQDFRAAFGLGDFPLRINTIDADGVALAGVQALETRTSALRAAVDELRRENDALRARLARLEAVLGGK
ncbi:MAG: tail fiber domain-containing protein [Vicinamibacterales bacterium]